jgi:uncharacterized FlaG/YvyC family protein
MVEEGSSIDSIGPIGANDTTVLPESSAVAPLRQPQRQPSAKELQDAVNKVNARLSTFSRVLELKVDAGSGLTIATVKDSQTGAVLQQFPGTNALQLAQMLADWSGGKNALLDLIA